VYDTCFCLTFDIADSPFPVLNLLQANDWVIWTAQTSAHLIATPLFLQLVRGCPLDEERWADLPSSWLVLSVSCCGLRPRQSCAKLALVV